MITELYVGRPDLVAFLGAARQDAVQHGVDLSFGTIRLIEPDEETFLPWATDRWACIVCNLHVVHTEEGIDRSIRDFRRLIDRVLEFGGRYFLTYHRWATREQVEAAYPRFVDFLREKDRRDPAGVFASTWHRHYRGLFGDRLR